MKSLFTSDPFGGAPFAPGLGQAPAAVVQHGGFAAPWGGSFFAVAPGGPTLRTPGYEDGTPEERRRRGLGQPEVRLTPDVADDYYARIQKARNLYEIFQGFLKAHPEETGNLADVFAKLERVAGDPLKSGIDWGGVTESLRRRASLTQRQMDAINALETAAKEAEPKLQEAINRATFGSFPAWGYVLVLGALAFGISEAAGVTNIMGTR